MTYKRQAEGGDIFRWRPLLEGLSSFRVYPHLQSLHLAMVPCSQPLFEVKLILQNSLVVIACSLSLSDQEIWQINADSGLSL